MPDREKVMRGLECCSRQRGGPELCEQCPYFNEPFPPCSNTLLHDALALLREQEERIKFLEKWTAYLEGGDPYEGKGVLSHD